MKVVQVAESLSIGDAVANDVVAIDALLKEMGVCGGIYATNANNINKRYLHTIAEPIDQIPELFEDDVLLFHHAIANDFCYKIPELKCKKVLVYHNITPPEFFKGLHEGLRDACQRGLDQMVFLNQAFSCCIADSEFNKQDLINMGFTCPIYVCPVLIPFEDYRREPNKNVIEKYRDGKRNILFVGRLSPNKKQEDIIHAFALYKKYYNQDSRLILVGSDGVEEYGKKIRKYVREIGVDDVIITGSVPFADILAYYCVADLFVCMSEHEGFCVPLIEAMFFDVPVLAYDSCAVPYTLGDSGVLLHTKDFALIAGWMHRMVTDNVLRTHIVAGQRKRLSLYSYEKVADWTKELLEVITGFDTGAVKENVVDVLFPKTEGKKDPQSFVLVMPIKASDWNSAKTALPLIRKNLRPRKIVVVSAFELKGDLRTSEDIVFVDENELIPNMSFGTVRETLKKAGGNPRFAGWYLQQFLKLGFSRMCEDDYYLVWDADMLPLNPISFFDKATGKPYLSLKREYVKPYFATIKNLLHLNKSRNESFIAEHMLFKTSLCRQMLLEFEDNSDIAGTAFWEKCIYGSAFDEGEQAFSEFETYGTYIDTQHPDAYELRKMRSFRCGKDFLGSTPSEEALEWVAKDFDNISFEHWSEPMEDSVCLCENESIRNEYSFAEVVKYICESYKIKALLGREEDIAAYRKLCLRTEFDYFFGDETTYEVRNRVPKSS